MAVALRKLRQMGLVERQPGVGLDRVDWIKLDTQGTDLRLIESLSDEVAATLMAVDAEPGIDAFYEGEDTFGDLHRAMIERGYWLADLSLDHGFPARIIVPALPGVHNTKWVASIDFRVVA